MDFYKRVANLVILLTFSCLNMYLHVSANATDYNIKVQTKCPVSASTCKGVTSKDGRVVVTLSSGLNVMCDTETDGGGWIIFQRRINGKVDFYRGWEDYRYGFGDYSICEFYLGNEIIHQLTSKRRFEMRVDLRFKNTNYFASYSRFRLYGEVESYMLKISDFSGNATDTLNAHGEQKFSTFDKDNDSDNRHCAELYHGAWWYNKCHFSNLNGKWASQEFGKGLNWGRYITGWYASVTMSEMKIREI